MRLAQAGDAGAGTALGKELAGAFRADPGGDAPSGKRALRAGRCARASLVGHRRRRRSLGAVLAACGVQACLGAWRFDGSAPPLRGRPPAAKRKAPKQTCNSASRCERAPRARRRRRHPPRAAVLAASPEGPPPLGASPPGTALQAPASPLPRAEPAPAPPATASLMPAFWLIIVKRLLFPFPFPLPLPLPFFCLYLRLDCCFIYHNRYSHER